MPYFSAYVWDYEPSKRKRARSLVYEIAARKAIR